MGIEYFVCCKQHHENLRLGRQSDLQWAILKAAGTKLLPEGFAREYERFRAPAFWGEGPEERAFNKRFAQILLAFVTRHRGCSLYALDDDTDFPSFGLPAEDVSEHVELVRADARRAEFDILDDTLLERLHQTAQRESSLRFARSMERQLRWERRLYRIRGLKSKHVLSRGRIEGDLALYGRLHSRLRGEHTTEKSPPAGAEVDLVRVIREAGPPREAPDPFKRR